MWLFLQLKCFLLLFAKTNQNSFQSFRVFFTRPSCLHLYSLLTLPDSLIPQFQRVQMCCCVVFGFLISIRNSVSHGNRRIRVTRKYWTVSDSSCVNEIEKKKTTTDGKQFVIVYKAQGFVYKVRNIPIGRIFRSSRLRGMFGFHDHLTSRFSLVPCPRRPVWSSTGVHQMDCTPAHWNFLIDLFWLPNWFPIWYCN